MQLLAHNPLVVDSNCDFQRRWLHKDFDLIAIFFTADAHYCGFVVVRVQVVRHVEQLVVKRSGIVVNGGIFETVENLPRLTTRCQRPFARTLVSVPYLAIN
jgi:hypothetical protein